MTRWIMRALGLDVGEVDGMEVVRAYFDCSNWAVVARVL